MFVINRGHKTIGFSRKEKSYVIGFQTATIARNVQYNLHPEPRFLLLEDERFTGTLFVPKLQGDYLDPMNDAGYHMSQHDRMEFYRLPATGLGIVIPFDLVAEDAHEFVFRAHVFDPTFSNQ